MRERVEGAIVRGVLVLAAAIAVGAMGCAMYVVIQIGKRREKRDAQR